MSSLWEFWIGALLGARRHIHFYLYVLCICCLVVCVCVYACGYLLLVSLYIYWLLHVCFLQVALGSLLRFILLFSYSSSCSWLFELAFNVAGFTSGAVVASRVIG